MRPPGPIRPRGPNPSAGVGERGPPPKPPNPTWRFTWLCLKLGLLIEVEVLYGKISTLSPRQVVFFR